MAGIRPPDNAAPAAPPESTEDKHCTLFVLSSQYVLFPLWLIYRNDADVRLCPYAPMSDFPKPSRMAERLLAHATMCQEAARLSWDEAIAFELEKLADDCRQAAAACEPELTHPMTTRWKN
jgi:hypothetical protein